jgi:hypothetical protein
MTARRTAVVVAVAVALFAVIFLVTGCTTVTTAGHLAPSVTTPSATASGAPHCGLERWPVKTGTDADAAKVDLSAVQPTTIAHLAALAAPPVLPQASRIPPVEVTVYQVTATLREYKIESDSDVHMVLVDAAGQTMITEIPLPACVGASSPFLPGITAARNAFDARFHPAGAWQQAGVTVTVTGVGFFDPEHGQTGGAVLAGGQVTIELHPVLDITPGTAASP